MPPASTAARTAHPGSAAWWHPRKRHPADSRAISGKHRSTSASPTPQTPTSTKPGVSATTPPAGGR